ncbi:MAG: phosphoribosylglycinamide formyltransferase-1 [Saprospiraceae bacterium]|jgi:phosphoribosylglycinamide formyltransferase-1
MKKISIFASGGGSNAQKIYDHFKGRDEVQIDSVVCNNSKAKIMERSIEWGCERVVVSKETFKSTEELSKLLLKRGTDLIVLAGFLWLIPESLLKAFPNKIVNIHPALLPKYGGKGMHGMNVHNAVEQAKENESGITVHYINEEYDKGDVIFQAKCSVQGLDADKIAAEVLKLEHKYFPEVIEKILLS